MAIRTTYRSVETASFTIGKGRDWDATIVKIVEHPISVRQAFWAPYKRFGSMVAEQIEKFSAGKEKAVEEKAAVAVTTGVTTAAQPAPAAGRSF